MKSPIRFILLIGFGSLLILIGFLVLSSFWKAEHLYDEMAAIHDAYRKADSVLDGIHANVYTTSIIVRDYLMDPRVEAMELYRNDLVTLRASMEKHLADLHSIAGTGDSGTFDRLRRAIDTYWNSRDSIFDLTPQQKSKEGFSLLRSVIPHRQAVILLTQEINDLNAANLQKEEQKISQSQAEFRRYMVGVFVVALSLALLIAGISCFHISRLERNSERERRRTEQTELELRDLSQKLVQAQEEERRSISRELHDEIGQMLTGLRLELRNVEELRTSAGPDFMEHLVEAKDLAERSLCSIRDLAMGLRPSMLDDLGLGPALQWQAREYARHNGIPAKVEVEGALEGLSDKLRTCVYRVVQESLTNCARHAHTKNVRVTVHSNNGNLAITIQDDGVGFDPAGSARRGIGLVGMEERVRELGGTMKISSQRNQGTRLEIAIPMMQQQAS
ncbi:MAG: hypothetical protein LAP85_20585 [Acidobacteriia bacterium]|nr:hypothetical protein [Terriglobia bacterium]